MTLSSGTAIARGHLPDHVTYNTFPAHVRSVDVGFVRVSGDLVSAGDAMEFFQVVEKADGDLYWLDLERLVTGSVVELDQRRVVALARFLAEAHAAKRDEPTLYHRRIRELVGHGECLMGILDSYPHPYPALGHRRPSPRQMRMQLLDFP